MRHLLLLCNRPASGANAATISEHLDSFQEMPGWKVWEISILGEIPQSIDLSKFDAVAIHYTLHLSDPDFHFLNKNAIHMLSKFDGLKCVWLHDEYRRVNQVTSILSEIGVHIIFSLAEGDTLRALYPNSILPNVRLETVFAGYISPFWLKQETEKTSLRPIDVGYRARRPPFWLGSLGQEKINIGLRFSEDLRTNSLVKDISVEEHHRLYAKYWIDFLSKCRTVLCVESGASVVDFTGDIEEIVENACATEKKIDFEEVSNRFLKDIDGKWLINPISPRVFEAAAMRCVMVAFPGHYSGLMQPWVHYIPLNKDYSNLNEVVEAIKNNDLVSEISENAWRDLALPPEHSYSAFASKCGNIMNEEIVLRENLVSAENVYTVSEFNRALFFNLSYMYRRYVAQLLQKFLFGNLLRGVIFQTWNILPNRIKRLIKPVLKIVGR